MPYEITYIDKGGGKNPATVQFFQGGFATEAEANAVAKKEKVYQLGSVAVRETPTTPKPGSFEYEGRTVTGEYYGPPHSEKGLELQRQNQQQELAQQAIDKTNAGQQVSSAEKEAYDRAKAQGLISTKPAEIPAFTANEYASATAQKIVDLGKAQEIANKAAAQNNAGDILNAYRELPPQYQTPETLKSIAQASEARQQAAKQQQDLNNQKALQGGNEPRFNSGMVGSIVSNNDISQNREMDLQRVNGFQSPAQTLQKDFGKRTAELESQFQNALEQGDNGNIFQRTGLITSYLGFKAAEGFGNTILHPIETIKGIGNLIISPIQTSKQIISAFESNPYGTAANFAGQAVALKPVGIITGKALEQIPKPKVRTLEIPQEKGVTVPVRMLGIETTGGNAIPIASMTPEGIVPGTPKLTPYFENLPEGTDIKIGSPLETAAIQRTIQSLPQAAPEVQGLSASVRAQQFIQAGQNVISPVLTTKSQFITSLPEVTERLGKQPVEILYDTAKKYDATIFGGTSRAAQLADRLDIGGSTFDVTNKVRDVDIRFTPEGLAKQGKTIQQVTDEVIEKFKKAGVQARQARDPQTGELTQAIEVKVDGQYIKATEFKGVGEVEKEVVPDYVLGFQKTGTPIFLESPVGKVQATGLAEELRGVMQGVARVRREGNVIDIYPPPKRIKDIGSVSVSARTLAESKINKQGYLKDIAKFESLFPEELVRSQVTAALEEGVPIASFGVSKQPKSTPPILSIFGAEYPSQGIMPKQSLSITSYGRSPKSGSVPSPLSIFSESPSSSPYLSESPSLQSVFMRSQSPSPSKSSSPRSTSPFSSPSSSPSGSPSSSPYLSESPYILGSPSSSVSPSSSSSPSPSKSGSPSSSSSFFPEPPSYLVPAFYPSGSKSAKARKQGFAAFVKRKGKFIQVSPIISEEAALDIGAEKARNTLAATFKVQPVQGDINENIQPTGFFQRTKGIFRDYAISKGSQVPLPNNVFIQKAKTRLGSSGERSEIMQAKNNFAFGRIKPMF